MSVADTLDQLLSIEQIKRLKASYFRCVDSQDWLALTELFTQDARFDMRDASGLQHDLNALSEGRANIIAYLREALAGVTTMHHGHMPEIEIISQDSAVGIWAMEDVLHWSEESDSPLRFLQGYGHYYDEYRRVAGRWQLHSCRISRLFVESQER